MPDARKKVRKMMSTKITIDIRIRTLPMSVYRVHTVYRTQNREDGQTIPYMLYTTLFIEVKLMWEFTFANTITCNAGARASAHWQRGTERKRKRTMVDHLSTHQHISCDQWHFYGFYFSLSPVFLQFYTIEPYIFTESKNDGADRLLQAMI